MSLEKWFYVFFILGAVVGTVVCSMFNIEEPMREPRDDYPRSTPYSRPSNTNRKNKVNKSKSTVIF